jgi:hypothetical protein
MPESFGYPASQPPVRSLIASGDFSLTFVQVLLDEVLDASAEFVGVHAPGLASADLALNPALNGY